MAAAVATNTSTVATSGNETEDGWETRMVEFLKPLAEYPGFCWFLVVLLTAMTAFGTFGNIMVIIAILKEKKLRSMGNMFVVNLTISDLGISMFVDPMAIVGIAGGYEFFYNKTPLCVTIATVCLVCCIASLLNITAISVNRYVVMCHTAIYNTIFTWPSTFVYCGLIWIASILIEIPTHFGWGNNKYDFKGLACLYDRTSDVSYTAFFAILSIVIPLFIVIFCYTRIYFFVRNSRRRIAASAPDALISQQRTRDELKLAKTLFITCFVFFIFWGMYGITVVFGNAWPMEWHALSLQIAHSTSSGINFILYGITNSRFRNAYYRILGIQRKKFVVGTIKASTVATADGTRNDTV